MEELLGRKASDLLKESPPCQEPEDGEVFLDVLALHNMLPTLKEVQVRSLRMTREYQHIN